MIALLLAGALQTPHVAELVDPTAKIVSVQAIVKLPELTVGERAAATLLAASIAEDVDGYSHGTMLDVTARAGDTVRVTLMPDELRIQVGVLPSDVKLGVAFVDQILCNSLLPEAAMNKAILGAPFRKRGIWETALSPIRIDFARVRRQDVIDLYHRLIRPENTWLAVGGPIVAGEAQKLWEARVADWAPGRAPRAPFDERPPEEVADVPGREAMIELRGREFSGTDAALSVKLLALIGLGSGKGSAMFERLREKQGWAYRLESVLWPTTSGFVPRLIMASGADLPGKDLAKAMKAELVDAVDHWTETDLDRARGMAQGVLLRGVPMSPLYFNPWWPVTDSIHDRTFLAAYWPMKTGRAWDPAKLVGEMALVDLTDFKAAGQAILTNAMTHVIPARK